MSEMSPIEKGIPIPDRRPDEYPFRDMDVGDSFFTTRKSVRPAATTFGHRHRMTFKTRSVTKDGIVGYRVWRTA